MKRVFLIRHAKSVPYGYEDDFNRDLKERGKNDAKLISKELDKQGIKAEAMFSSPAKRAIKTARIFAYNMGFKKKNIQELEILYEGATTSEFLDIINRLPNDLGTVFFFGHNPDFQNYTNRLLNYYDGDMPTCATIGIDFSVERWDKISTRTGKLK